MRIATTNIKISRIDKIQSGCQKVYVFHGLWVVQAVIVYKLYCEYEMCDLDSVDRAMNILKA